MRKVYRVQYKRPGDKEVHYFNTPGFYAISHFATYKGACELLATAGAEYPGIESRVSINIVQEYVEDDYKYVGR